MPNIVKEGNFVWFGVYPQARKEDSVRIVSSMTNGMFAGSDGEVYAAIRGDADAQQQFAAAGDSLQYYRMQPIKWRIISDKVKGGIRTLSLLSEVVLDAIPFQNEIEQVKNKYTVNVGENVFEANDWEGSFVRRWLHSVFMQTAYTNEMSAYLARAWIVTDGYKTQDRIYLPSAQVAKAYKIADCVFSDYALARGGTCGEIWLREAGNHSGSATFVPKKKESDKEPNVLQPKGILPMIHLQIAE